MRQLAILILALPLFAQTTASLTGTVTSQGGQPIPGVTVIATSASLQGMRSAITGETGMYTLRALPPGPDPLEFARGRAGGGGPGGRRGPRTPRPGAVL